MSKNFSPISKIFYFIFLLVITLAMLGLAYGWSIDQTAEFASAIVAGSITVPIFGTVSYALMLALFIQLFPQGAFTIAADAQQRVKELGHDRYPGRLPPIGSVIWVFWIAIGLGLAFNFIDMFTNVITFLEKWPDFSANLVDQGRSEMFVSAAYPVGIFIAMFITWAEELILLAIGEMLLLVLWFLEDMRVDTPQWFRNAVKTGNTDARKAAGVGWSGGGKGGGGNGTPGGQHGGKPGGQGRGQTPSQAQGKGQPFSHGQGMNPGQRPSQQQQGRGQTPSQGQRPKEGMPPTVRQRPAGPGVPVSGYTGRPGQQPGAAFPVVVVPEPDDIDLFFGEGEED